MKRQFKIGLATVAIAFSLGAAQAEDMMKLKIGTEGAYPPFNNLESDGSLTGFDVDIAKALCVEMKADCEFVTQDWDGIIPALQAGKFDAIIASMSITDERLEKVDFTNPYYTNSLVLIAPKDTDISAPTAEGLSGKVVGAQGGTVGANYIDENFTDSEMKPYPTQEEMYLDLENGRLDGGVGDIGVMSTFLKTEAGACCKSIGEPFLNDDKIGIAIRKGETELVEKFNKAIEAIRANGKYKEVNDKYFDFDVFGG